jgi:hypothetical protein
MSDGSLKIKKDREGEKGAAMVMALMMSFLLLIASAGLLLESAFNTQNVTDATSEQQAYNAAESGIQSAINVLRGNVVPSPLLDTSKPATDVANKINFTKALSLSSSNKSTDAATVPRLSRWLGYDATCNDRVLLGGTSCSTLTGYAYSLTISDPDNTGSVVSFNTTGRLFDSDTGNPTQKTYGTGANTITVRYTPKTVNGLNVASAPGATDYGTFTVTKAGTGASIGAFNRFEIKINMTRPYTETRIIRGYIETNSAPGNAPKIIFDAQTFSLMGSDMVLNYSWGSPTNVSVLTAPQRVGYEAQLALGNNVLTGTISSPEPTRLLLRSTGYGPRGARKNLEAIIQKDFFNGLSAPATLMLVGPPSTTSPTTTFTFNPGSSSVTVYSGDDVVSTDIIPPIGTTNDGNLGDVEDSVAGEPPHPFNGSVIGSAANVSEEMPEWLATPTALDATVQKLATVADSSGRFFVSGAQPTTFGDNVTGLGITFCDGNCSFTGNGGGIMVVTGKLTLSGNFSFNGLIIVTGAAGVERSGGGNGTIQGNIVVAPYVANRIADNTDPAPTADFLSPQYDLSGGGNSTVVYNSKSVANGMVAVSNFVLGIMEK